MIAKLLSKRWETAFFLLSGILINYCLRVNISIAASEIKDDLGWTEAEKGYVLSSFFWGNTIGQLPAILIARKIGHKFTFGFAVFASSLLSMFMPAACHSSISVALLTRALIGLASSALFPASFHFFPRWVPLAEKTLMISFIGTGVYLGEILGFGLSGYLISLGTDREVFGFRGISGWPSTFYLFGLMGILWTPLYAFGVYGSPEEHPHISEEEVYFIKNGVQKGHVVVSPMYPADDGIREERVRSHASFSIEDGLGDLHTSFIRDERASKSRTSRNLLNFNGARKSRRSSVAIRSSVASAIASETGALYYDMDPHISSHSEFITHSVTSFDNRDTITKFDVGSEQATNNVTSNVKLKDELASIPWVMFFTESASLVLFLCHWTNSWIGFMLLNQLPTFLMDELGYDILAAGALSVVPYIANFVSTIMFAMIFDYAEDVRGWSVREVRQVSTRVTFLGAGLSLVACSFVDIKEIAYTFLILAMFFYGAYPSGLSCAFLDVSPNYSSIINTIGSTFGSVAGLAGPLVVTAFTTSLDGSQGWRAVFMLTLFQCIVTLIFWKIYQTSEIVPALNTPLVVQK